MSPAGSEIFTLWFLKSVKLGELAARFTDVSLELLVLFLIISIGIFTLRALEGLDLETKLWDFMVCGLFILLWPIIVMELKDAVDGLNVLIVDKVFQSKDFFSRGLGAPMSWEWIKLQLSQGTTNSGLAGFFETWKNAGFNLPVSTLALLLNILVKASMSVIEVFYNAYFYLYTLLGPIVIARAIFADHLESLFELLQEFLVLMLWPTMFVVLTGISSFALATSDQTGDSFSKLANELDYQITLIVLTLFVPAITKKFAVHIGASIISPLLRFTGIALGLTGLEAVASTAGKAIAGAGFHGFHFAHSAEKYISLGEIVHEHGHAQHAHHVAHKLHHTLHQSHHAGHGDHGHDDHGHGDHGHGDHGHDDHGHHDEHHEHHEHHDHHHEGHHEEHHEHHNEHHEHHDHGDSHHEGHGEHGHSELPLASTHVKPGALAEKIDQKIKDRADFIHGEASGSLSKFAWRPSLRDLGWFRKIRHPVKTTHSRSEFLRERTKAREFLGPKDSEKNKDMVNCGIDHSQMMSNDFATVIRYRRAVQLFHLKHGWLYDFQGRFLGFENRRPGKVGSDRIEIGDEND